MTDRQQISVAEHIESRIFLVRGQRVMLGTHLAEMYEVGLEALDQAVERNIEYFPEGSVFRLTLVEIASPEMQGVIQDQTTPYAFTGPGIAMLASILFDENAITNGRDACVPTCGCRD